MASFNCPYSGHQNLMSGTWPVLSVDVPDIKMWCPEYGQLKLAMFQTSLILSVHITDITVPILDTNVYIPDITVLIPDITVRIPDITVHVPDINIFLLSMFRTSNLNVRNMDSKNCLYPRHQFLMSGIRRVKTGHIPDIEFWCPGYGQFLLAIFRTSIFT